MKLGDQQEDQGEGEKGEAWVIERGDAQEDDQEGVRRQAYRLWGVLLKASWYDRRRTNRPRTAEISHGIWEKVPERSRN